MFVARQVDPAVESSYKQKVQDMENFTTEIIEKAKGAKTVHELLEIAKAEGINITVDEAATYFAQLNPEGTVLSDDELGGVSGGGCGDDLPLYTDYSMVQEFFCLKCLHVHPASRCKVMHYEKKDDEAFCPDCNGEVYPAEKFIYGKV